VSGLDTCLACGRDDVRPVADLGKAPVLVGALFRDRDAARGAVQGGLELALCLACGHVQNVAFDPDLIQYDVDYDNSLHYSGTFQRYSDELVARLVTTYDVRGKHVVEIGSGQGDFLRSITETGGNTGVGYDPASPVAVAIPGVRLVADYVTPDADLGAYDLLVCRHVLEHLDDPAELMRTLRKTAPDDAVFYFEVPAAEFNFGPDGLWDCIFPHVSYFSEQSLATLALSAGFDVIATGRSFHDQFSWIEARATDSVAQAPPNPARHVALVEEFAGRWRSAADHWRSQLSDADRHGVAMWGAGAKGVSFLNVVDPAGTMPVVDLNPRKAGSFLPGSGHEVGLPDSLVDHDIDRVLITNPAYRAEITATIHELGIRAEVVVV
jgi:SAM-dependent methyltransferase